MTEHQATYMIDLLERILYILGRFESRIDWDPPDLSNIKQPEPKEPT